MSQNKKIQVDPQELRGLGTHFQHASADIRQLVTDLRHAPADLDPGAWTGAAAARPLRRGRGAGPAPRCGSRRAGRPAIPPLPGVVPGARSPGCSR